MAGPTRWLAQSLNAEGRLDQVRCSDDGRVTDVVWLSAADLIDAGADAALDAAGGPADPLAVVDLEPLGLRPPDALITALRAAAAERNAIVVARCARAQVDVVRPIADACAMTLVATEEGGLPHPFVAVHDPDCATNVLADAVRAAPRAAVVLHDLLRAGAELDVRSALFAESAAYSMLLAGPEFATWLSTRPTKPDAVPVEPPVLVARDGDTLTITLNRPERRNAFGRWVRDAACDALDIARLDPGIDSIRLQGAGPAFCSGGDLDEFGTQPDVVAGHLIRLDRSVGWRLHQLADRTVAELHGACVGAGIELPAFAGRVLASTDAWFELPELRMGLVPGAGGTVSLPRRIGRWRTAWLAMTGERIDVATAHEWGLVDEHVR